MKNNQICSVQVSLLNDEISVPVFLYEISKVRCMYSKRKCVDFNQLNLTTTFVFESQTSVATSIPVVEEEDQPFEVIELTGIASSPCHSVQQLLDFFFSRGQVQRKYAKQLANLNNRQLQGTLHFLRPENATNVAFYVCHNDLCHFPTSDDDLSHFFV